MRGLFCLVGAGAAVFASAQSLNSIYNRDSGESFKLLNMTTETKVLGPVSRTRTVFTFENPYKKLTEASFNFDLASGSVLEGFAYWYKDEYVKGQLMDKALAWFIYTAITSRDRDPGIMEQTSPESFHAQIYPLAVGHPLKIELVSIDYLLPAGDRAYISQPMTGPDGESADKWEVYGNGRETYSYREEDALRTVVTLPGWADPLDVDVLAQTFNDGRTYVVGWARGDLGKGLPEVQGLSNVQYPYLDEYGYAFPEAVVQDMAQRVSFFAGWTTGRSFTVTQGNLTRKVMLNNITKGDDAAKLWAQSMLANSPRSFKSRQQVLDFSLKYQVPSTATALLAVPKSEMKLFEKAKKEYMAKLRKEKLERKRLEREWENERNVNTPTSGGGDPEIRIKLPGAVRAIAKLPDGRVINLKKTESGFWYGNFDIPIDAPEGDYKVQIIGVKANGERVTQQVSYSVDRTPPVFEREIKMVDGVRVLEVRSEKGLAEVVLVLADGRRLILKEVEPGVYRVALPSGWENAELILVDGASNKTRSILRR